MAAESNTQPKSVEVGTIHLPRDLLNKAKVISAHCDETIAAIITQACRPAVERRYKAALEKLNRELGGEAGGA